MVLSFDHHHRFHGPHHGGHRHAHGGGPGRGPKMFDAGAMRFAVLHLIAEKPRHGYELIKEIEALAGGAYAPSPGAIYPLLAMLLDMGQIDSTQDGNKKLHAITDDGRAFLAENRQLVDAVLARLRNPGDGHDDARALMHALKQAVIDSYRAAPDDAGRHAQIRAILQRATIDIEGLA
ncbi:PadR family transcriptional regulator [Massilia sp. PWRC2]|uniref:PadR family transcriptional regulator n=1 Tax=Massilia sp. PWRC2 TaxID=2804626 RepID=UPI003CF31F61